MKFWMDVSQYVNEALSIVLIFRLLNLRDRRNAVYSVFIAFLSAQLLGTLGYFASRRWELDYRVVWLICATLISSLSLGMVYALSRAVLAELPGVLRFSRTLLGIAFVVAMAIAFSTSSSEYGVSRAREYNNVMIDHLLFIARVADKAIALASAVVLLVILGFILWFPVKMSRNLAIFSVGFVVYFSVKTGLDLWALYSAPKSLMAHYLAFSASLVGVPCFVYWLLFLSRAGQTAEVRTGVRAGEKEKLVNQLESLNGLLLRNSQRLEL